MEKELCKGIFTPPCKIVTVKDSIISGSSISASSPDKFLYLPILGTTSQNQVGVKYVGAQCTSMAITAMAWSTCKPVRSWNSADIDRVLKVGGKNHVFYRDRLGLSDHPDGRLSIDEIPPECWLRVSLGKKDNFFKKKSVFAGPVVECAGLNSRSFPPLAVALQKLLLSYRNCVVTVGDYSLAITLDDHAIWMIDSHGHDGRYSRGVATARPFTSIVELVTHIVRVYGYHNQYVAAGLQYMDSSDAEEFKESLIFNKKKQIKCKPRKAADRSHDKPELSHAGFDKQHQSIPTKIPVGNPADKTVASETGQCFMPVKEGEGRTETNVIQGLHEADDEAEEKWWWTRY